MKKLSIFAVFLLCFSISVFAEDAPIAGKGWYWEDGITLNGKRFYNVADSYREQDGYAYIEGYGNLHYWLYDTYTYHNGDGNDIVDKYVPQWIESMGYVFDFINVENFYPNNNLASSVKALMTERKCDVSVTVNISASNPYVVINSYDKNKRTYGTSIIQIAREDEFYKPFYSRTAQNGCVYELRNGRLGSKNRFFVLEIRESKEDETSLMIWTEYYTNKGECDRLRERAMYLISKVLYGKTIDEIRNVCKIASGCELEDYGTDIDSVTGKLSTYFSYYLEDTSEFTDDCEDYF